MKILVTGASGFIGSNLVEALAANEKNDIRATGRSSSHKFDHLLNVTYFRQDLSGEIPDQICDVCIHCAGLADDKASKDQFKKDNIKATENLLRALRQCRVLIFISSASVYDFADGKVKLEQDAQLNSYLSIYGESKLLAEEVVSISGISSVYILRPRAVYGRGDRVLLPRVLRLIRKDKMILPGKLSSNASMTHIRNLSEVVVKCLEQSSPGVHIFNVADKTTYDLKMVFRAILLQKLGKTTFLSVPMPIVRLYAWLGSHLGGKAKLTTQSLKYITENSVISVEKAEKLLDYMGQLEFYSSVDQLDI